MPKCGNSARRGGHHVSTHGGIIVRRGARDYRHGGGARINSVPAAGAGGYQEALTEYTQNQHTSCSTSKRVCDIERVEVLDEVLDRWENTPAYGKYAVEVIEWHSQLAVAISTMASNYAVRHGGSLDAGFEAELFHRMGDDPAFQPPKEYTCRHMFGSAHFYDPRGNDLCAQ